MALDSPRRSPPSPAAIRVEPVPPIVRATRPAYRAVQPPERDSVSSRAGGTALSPACGLRGDDRFARPAGADQSPVRDPVRLGTPAFGPVHAPLRPQPRRRSAEGGQVTA